MRRILPIFACALLILPATAMAQETNAPPGNSGIDEYLETVPAASGNKPVKPNRGGNQGIAPATRRALEAQGQDGKLAADLAAGSAPAGAPSRSTGSGGSPGDPDSGGASTLPDKNAGSPIGAVVEAVTGGSNSDSGMGPLLPILLALALASMVAAALLRKRASG